MFLGGSYDIRPVITLVISEFAILAGIKLLLYAAERAEPNVFVGSFRLDHEGGGTLFRLLTSIWSLLNHFGLYEVAESMHMDQVLASLLFYRVAKVDWLSSGGSKDFVA